ncbi:1-deoxy-D-xylulose-5-phosphate reductoisomerase [Candidatus Spongiihabitans sp.]|uniref:1-deoxy-D-xylulose-5-phosphate reductoisomerase n=1 Tax=Candidatus Spongiihabitans sp. TaxID=3101308 RepID=UPI003C7C46E5
MTTAMTTAKTTGVTLLGSTGSIGINTLEVIARHPDKYHVCALAANTNVAMMFAQCQKFQPEKVVMADAKCARKLQIKIKQAGIKIDVESGQQALCSIAGQLGETIVCAIVGAAGLMSTIAAVKSGNKVLIANKEPLVMLGEYIVRLARDNAACLLPLDSEHNAIFQCLPQPGLAHRNDNDNDNANAMVTDDQGIKKILLTGSGGPLLRLPLNQLSSVTPDQACAHPNWQMGRKISVDSATMMNKGLELIEACALFGVSENMIEIVVHPQSVVHSMVEYIDGSIIAQLSRPDMRIPIASALAWPHRIVSGAAALSLQEVARLDFEAPDDARFPALRLAQNAAQSGGTLPAIMNAANEVAVDAFLNGQISFDKIARLVERTMERSNSDNANDLDTVLAADREARMECARLLAAVDGAG